MHIRQYFSHSTTYSQVSQHSTTLKWNLSSFNTYNGPLNSRNRKPCTGDEAQAAAQAAAHIRRAATAAFRTQRATRVLLAGSQGGGSRTAALSSRQGGPGAGLARERRLDRGAFTTSRKHLSAFCLRVHVPGGRAYPFCRTICLAQTQWCEVIPRHAA